MSVRAPLFTSCALRQAGDLQIEAVLSLLLMRPRRGTGFPRTAILDFGCGNGSLLEGLRTFPPHMLERISYVGIDTDEQAVADANRIASFASSLTPKILPLRDVLADCRIATPSAAASAST